MYACVPALLEVSLDPVPYANKADLQYLAEYSYFRAKPVSRRAADVTHFDYNR